MNKIVPKNEEYIFEGKVAISQTNLKGDITFVNRKFCEISGYTVNELVNSNHDIIKHPDIHETTFEKMWKALNSGQVWNGMLKNLRKDGRYYWVDIEIAPIFDKQERITGFISVSKPSARKNIEDSEKQLHQADSTK
ncbi:MAG: PAS domain-containing protein [Sulfurimonas sp.]|uniref:PAS domain-containing protein n=1 Tax=Sulfurimonas sp. TaxID=2022749 RepID=UPI002611F97A|nr:PAS domain-containing protein [Sulfurimonas sp.]MDD5373741.1 PAS domain-containing protein [Sulfurimonas sp.]